MFTNMLETVLYYSNTNPTQQMDTRTGTLFGVHNAFSGYFHILKNYKIPKPRLYPSCQEFQEQVGKFKWRSKSVQFNKTKIQRFKSLIKRWHLYK